MRRALACAAAALAAAGHAAAGPPTPPADPASAEAHFRVALRLAADKDPSAAAAFERVIADAPAGEWAAPSFLSLARLASVPEWPEDLGRVTADQRARAGALLDRAIALGPPEGLAQEATYLGALLRAAPLPGRDAARARRDLIAVASAPAGSGWSGRARYALGRLDEAAGRFDGAAGAYARVLVEDPDGAEAPRARAGFARLLLRSGRFGEAVATLDDEAAEDAAGTPSRALALRSLTRATDPARRWSATETQASRASLPRGATLLAFLPDGGACAWDRKAGIASFLGPDGAVRSSVALSGVTALAAKTRPYGSAAIRDQVLLVDPRGTAPSCPLAPLTTAGAIAVDGAGRIWAVDRHGERVARCAPGGAMEVVREARGAEIVAVAVSGSSVVAADAKTGQLVAIAEDGSEAPIGAALRRPQLLAVDPAGQIAVFEEKGGAIALLAPDGSPRDELSLERAGVARPVALGFAADGALRVVDAGNAALVTVP